MKIFRYAEPNMYDHAALGTECHVHINDKEYEVYIQRSKDESSPIWEYVGIEYYNVTS